VAAVSAGGARFPTFDRARAAISPIVRRWVFNGALTERSRSMDVLMRGATLEAHLDDPDLRILDCTVNLRRDPSGGAFTVESGLADWQQGHVPNSAYLDPSTELSEPHRSLRFSWPTADRVKRAMEGLGVGEGTRLVVYDRQMNMWATRVWWLLHAYGFDQVSVLDGGWASWTNDGRPVSTDPAPTRPGAAFTPMPRTGCVATKDEVMAAIGSGATCIVNSLSAAQHRGEDLSYGRPGHIPSAINIPAAGLVDPVTHQYLDLGTLRGRFADALGRERVITYCGGGIAATSDAFVLSGLLGHRDVGVYDGSMSEWVQDPEAPLEV
jgi:thiosulfate/3-mercaptopyruvate sulfurtransferase